MNAHVREGGSCGTVCFFIQITILLKINCIDMEYIGRVNQCPSACQIKHRTRTRVFQDIHRKFLYMYQQIYGHGACSMDVVRLSGYLLAPWRYHGNKHRDKDGR